MQRLAISIIMDLTSSAPQGPGWYVAARSDDAMVVPPVAVASDAAYEASRAIQETLQTTDGELPQVSLPQLAESASALIRQALEDALRDAEAQAAKVAVLRRKLAKLPQPEKKADER